MALLATVIIAEALPYRSILLGLVLLIAGALVWARAQLVSFTGAVSRLNYASNQEFSDNVRYRYPKDYHYFDLTGDDEFSEVLNKINDLTYAYQMSQKYHLSFEMAQRNKFDQHKTHANNHIVGALNEIVQTQNRIQMLHEDISAAQCGNGDIQSTLNYAVERLAECNTSIQVSIQELKEIGNSKESPKESYTSIGYLAEVLKMTSNNAFDIMVSPEIENFYFCIDSLQTQVLATKCSKFILGRDPQGFSEGKVSMSFTGRAGQLMNYAICFRPPVGYLSGPKQHHVELFDAIINGSNHLQAIEGFLTESDVVTIWDLSQKLNAKILSRWIEKEAVPEVMLVITTATYAVPPVEEVVVESDQNNVVPFKLVAK